MNQANFLPLFEHIASVRETLNQLFECGFLHSRMGNELQTLSLAASEQGLEKGSLLLIRLEQSLPNADETSAFAFSAAYAYYERLERLLLLEKIKMTC